MVVGHNPGMEALVTHLTGRMETMPTAALAHVALPIEKMGGIGLRGTRGVVGFVASKSTSIGITDSPIGLAPAEVAS